MNYIEYYQQCPVTLKRLEDKKVTAYERNINHMVYGLEGEIGEIIAAIEKGDKVELREELGDSTWFHACYQHLKYEQNFRVLTQLPTEDSDGILFKGDRSLLGDIKNGVSKVYYWLTRSGKRILKDPYYFMKQLSYYQQIVSKLTDIEKREYIYSKPQDDLNREISISQLGLTLSKMIKYAGFTQEEVFIRNIEKLQKVRYKSGGYTDKEAVERDLQSERKELSK